MQSKDAEEDNTVNNDEFLTFFLGEEEYGVDILSVQGIQGWDGVTRIPDTPDYMLGVINLRGAIVPILDMRVKFRLDSAEFNTTTVVIVVKAEVNDSEHVLGLVVDAVSEVYKMDQTDIQTNPEFGNDQENDLVKGLINIDGNMVIILDVDMLVQDWVPEAAFAEALEA